MSRRVFISLASAISICALANISGVQACGGTWVFDHSQTTWFIVCSSWEPGGPVGGGGEEDCHYESEEQNYYRCEPIPGPGGGGGGGGGTPPPPPPNPLDLDNDGKVDCWHMLMNSSHPGKDVLEPTQKLGSDFGGPNTDRPDHTGVDMDCNAGDPVLAGFDGTVILAGSDPKAGNKVRIRSRRSGEKIAYAHLKDIAVSEGDSVKPGTVIGHCNASGSGGEGGNHLHYEVRQSDESGSFFENAETVHPCP